MGLVQSAQGSTSGAGPTLTLTITLGSATTAGNSLVVLIAGSATTSNPSSVSAVTLGGSADNFAQVSAFGTTVDAANGFVWLDQNCAGGQTSVAITTAGSSGTDIIVATVYEWAGLYPISPLDQAQGALSTGTSWTVTTSTTTQADEVWFGGIFTLASTAGTITGPSSPWTNLTQVSQTNGSFADRWMSGYQVVSSTGTATYAGTVSPSSEWVGTAVAFKLDTGGPYTQTFAATGTWTAPTGVTSAQVECWGGGGAGGSGRAVASAGPGGGAGGAYAKTNAYTVSAGTTYTVTVGAGGAHSTGTFTDGSAAGSGGDSWFDSTSGPLAKGGTGGINKSVAAAGAGATGTTTGSIGDVKSAGGNGAAGTTSIGGGGGGGAGTGGAGGNASGSTRGTGTAVGGGNGSAGVSAANAVAGSVAGGAGGGARTSNTTARSGGDGAHGQISITWSTSVGPSNFTQSAAATVALTPVRVLGVGRQLPAAGVTTTGARVRQVRPTKRATVAVSRAMLRRVGRVLVTTLTLVAFVAKSKVRLKTLLTSVTLTGRRVRRIAPVKAATVAVTRFRTLRIQPRRVATVTFVGARVRALSLRRAVVVTATEAMLRRIATARRATVTLTGASARMRVRLLTLAAVVTLTRSTARTVQRLRTFAGVVILNGSKVRQVRTAKRATVNATEAIVRRLAATKKATLTLVGRHLNAAARRLRATVTLTGFKASTAVQRILRAALVSTAGATIRRTSRSYIRAAQVSTAGVRRSMVGRTRAAQVTLTRKTVRRIGAVRSVQVLATEAMRRGIARRTRATVTLAARYIPAGGLFMTLAAVVSTAGTLRRGLNVRHMVQVLTSPARLRAIGRRSKATVTTTGARVSRRAYVLTKAAFAATVGARASSRAYARALRAVVTLTGRRVRRIARTTLRTVTTVGVKRVAIRLTNATRMHANVVLRGFDKVLRLLAPGHSSPGILTGRKPDSSAMSGRPSAGGIAARETAAGAAIIGRSTTGGMSGNRHSSSGMAGAPTVVNGAVSMYRVVKSTHVSAKGSVRHR